jgi:hypothetical protein
MAESGTALKFNSQKVSDKRMGAKAGREEGKKAYTRTDNPNEHAAMLKAFAVTRQAESSQIRYPMVIFSANISPERSSSAPCMASCLV